MKVLFLILLFPACAMAGGNHHQPVTNEYNEYITNNSYTDCVGSSVGYAASNINHYWSTNRLQMSVAYGNVGSCETLMFGIAKRFKENGPMFSITTGHSQGRDTENGIGLGATWLLE